MVDHDVRQKVLMGLLTMVVALSTPAVLFGGEPIDIGTAPSEKYGNGQQVVYMFNSDYTAYGVGRGGTKGAAEERAKANCVGSGCGAGERGAFMPGCIAIMKTGDGAYWKHWEMGRFPIEKAHKKCLAKTGSPCQLEVYICSN